MEDSNEVPNSGIGNGAAEGPAGSVPPVSLGLDLTGSRAAEQRNVGGEKATRSVGKMKEERVFWPEYTSAEREVLRGKLQGNWEDLRYLDDFWNVVHDDRDFAQYRDMAKVWQLRETGLTFKQIGARLDIDSGRAGGFATGYNRRPNLAFMYLNWQKLGKPKDGWKWILDCTPKPTNPYPRALQVPEHIRDYHDILEFLEQFPPVPDDSEALRFFGLSSAWAFEHRAELFWFLMSFLVGDGGKQYVHTETRARHYKKTAMTTNMKYTDSNFRVLRYVQLGLETIGIRSHEAKPQGNTVRWNSVASNAITWIMQVCIGMKEGQTTSQNQVDMPWLKSSPKNLIIAFIQGIADSDGSVDKHGYYTNISTVPNPLFYKELFSSIGIEAHAYPTDKPQMVRVWLKPALDLPFFNPIIKSYRFDQMVEHGKRRGLIP